MIAGGRPGVRPCLATAVAAVLAAASLGFPGFSSAAAEVEAPAPAAAPGWVVLDQRPAEGEQCIVCRLPTRAGDIVEARYKGRRFFVAAKMLDRFAADPEAYFHQLGAHGGLFDEAAMETPPIETGWLVFGLYVLAGLVAGAACSYIALDRGLPAWGWFFAGLAANALAVAAVLTRRRVGGPAGSGLSRPGMTKIPTTPSPLACGRCGESNHPAASACASCGEALERAYEPETARA